MRTLKGLIFVGAALSVFAISFSASAEEHKSGKASVSQMGGKGGKTSTKDIGKSIAGKGGGHGDSGVGGAVGDAIGGSVGGAVGGALGGFLGSLAH
jgi:hypothetical protein